MGIQTRENRENQSGGANKERNQRNNQRNNNQQQQQRERRDSGRNELQENKGGYRVSLCNCSRASEILIVRAFAEPESTPGQQ